MLLSADISFAFHLLPSLHAGFVDRPCMASFSALCIYAWIAYMHGFDSMEKRVDLWAFVVIVAVVAMAFRSSYLSVALNRLMIILGICLSTVGILSFLDYLLGSGSSC